MLFHVVWQWNPQTETDNQPRTVSPSLYFTTKVVLLFKNPTLHLMKTKPGRNVVYHFFICIVHYTLHLPYLIFFVPCLSLTRTLCKYYLADLCFLSYIPLFLTYPGNSSLVDWIYIFELHHPFLKKNTTQRLISSLHFSFIFVFSICLLLVKKKLFWAPLNWITPHRNIKKKHYSCIPSFCPDDQWKIQQTNNYKSISLCS